MSQQILAKKIKNALFKVPRIKEDNLVSIQLNRFNEQFNKKDLSIFIYIIQYIARLR